MYKQFTDQVLARLEHMDRGFRFDKFTITRFYQDRDLFRIIRKNTIDSNWLWWTVNDFSNEQFGSDWMPYRLIYCTDLQVTGGTRRKNRFSEYVYMYDVAPCFECQNRNPNKEL